MFTDTSSVASSRSQLSAVRNQFSTNMLSSVFPVFPFMMALESNTHKEAAIFVLVVQFFQALAFAVNPRQLHGETLKAVGAVVYAFQLPFWDSSFMPFITFNVYMGFFAIAVAMTLLLVLTLIFSILRKNSAQHGAFHFVVWRHTLHLITSVLFIPFLQCFLSQMICKNGYLWAFPSQKCYQGSSTLITFILSTVSLILLVIITLIKEICLFPQDPRSEHPLARGHNVTDYIYTLWRFLSCVLFQVFTSEAAQPDTEPWVGMYILFSGVLVAAAYAFFLPFYDHIVNRLHVTASLIVAIAGLLAFMSFEKALTRGEVAPLLFPNFEFSGQGAYSIVSFMDIDGLIFMCSILPLCYLGFWIADLRLNDFMLMAVANLLNRAAPPPPEESEYAYPKHLPVYDTAYDNYIDLCNDIADGAAIEDSSPFPSLPHALLSAVYTATDVEVATRFLRVNEVLTGNPPSEDMLFFASSIYIKGLLRFKEAGGLAVSFANMISVYTTKQTLALQQCERCAKMPLPFSSDYRAFQLHTRLSQELNLRDNTYQRLCDQAKKAHKEALILMHQLWSRLQSKQDVGQLMVMAAQATASRDAGDALFLKALHYRSTDSLLVLKYADFLEQIMLKADIADALRGVIRDDMEARKRNAMDRKRTTVSRHNTAVNGILKSWRRRNSLFFSGDLNVVLLSRLFIPFMLFLFSVSFIVVSVVTTYRRSSAFTSIYNAGRAHALAMMGALLVVQQFVGEDGGGPVDFALSGTRLNTIQAIGYDMLAIHNTFTDGGWFASYAREDFLRKKAVVSAEYITPTSIAFDVDTFWGQGFSMAQFLLDISSTIGRNSTYHSAEAQEILSLRLEMQKLTAVNIMERWYGLSYNISKDFVSEWVNKEEKNTIILASVLYAVSIVSVILLAVLLTVGTNEAVALRRNVVALFALIPTEKVQEIAEVSKQRVDTYDEMQREDDVGGLAGGVDDRFGRNARGDGLGGGVGGEDYEEYEEDARGAQGKNKASAKDLESSGTGPKAGKGVHRVQGDLGESSSKDADADGTSFGDLSNGDVYDSSNEAAIREHLLSTGECDGGGESSDGSDGTQQREAELKPLTFYHFLTIGVLVLLLAATLILVVTAVPEQNNEFVQCNQAIARIGEYNNVEETLWRTLIYTIRFFTTGARDAYILTIRSNSFLPMILDRCVALRPAAVEMEALLQLIGLQDDYSTLSLGESANFLTAPSDITDLFVSESELPPKDPIGEAARDAMFGVKGTFEQRFREALQGANKTQLAAQDVLEAVAVTKTNLNLIIAATAISSAAFGALVVVVLLLIPQRRVFFTRLKTALVLIIGLSTAAIIGCCAAQVIVLEKYDVEKILLGQSYVNLKEYWGYFMVPWMSATLFAQSSRRLDYETYFNFVVASTPPNSTHVTNTTLYEEYLNAVDEMKRMQGIAMRLVASGVGLKDTEDADRITWSFNDEPDAERVRINYPDEPLRYTNTSADLLLNSRTKVLMGRFTLISPRFLALQAQASSLANALTSEMNSSLGIMAKSYQRMIKALSITSIVCAGAAFGLTSLYLILSMSHYYDALRQQQLFIDSSLDRSTVFSMLGIRTPLLFFLGLFTAQYLLIYFSISSSQGYTALIRHSFGSVSLVLSGMLEAERWIGQFRTRMEAQLSLTTTAERLLTLFQDLHRERGIHLSKARSLDTRGATLSPPFSVFYSPPSSVSAELLLANGLTVAEFEWLDLTVFLASVSSLVDGVQIIEALRSIVMPLTAAMQQSAWETLSAVRSSMELFDAMIIVVACLTCVAVIFVFVLVVYPLMARQEADKNGSRTLLRFIPDDVRDSIPAIGEWIAAERIESKGGLQRNSESFTGRDAIVVIDSDGIILRFNSEAEEVFGFKAAEVVGNNVSMLMPERIAEQHGSHLERCRRRPAPSQGQMFSRKVFAKHKLGHIFPIVLTVHMFFRESGETVFIGFVRDITKEVEMRKEEQLNNLIQDHATVPMIAIDSLGTVLRFNRAAEECFGHAAHDIVNQNVKILMPEAIASRHDTYLATYLRTRQKHVINSATRTRGMRKSGEEFDVELVVKEIVVNDGTSTYLGFIRDLSQEVALVEVIQINSSVIDLSPIPIIIIDPYGKVLKFSTAATRTFGYDASEVVNNNCKMLMPDRTADLHDGYLAGHQSHRRKNAIAMDREVVGRRKDGSDVALRVCVHEVKKSGITSGAFIGFCTELTENRQMEWQLTIDSVVEENHQVPLVVANAVGIIQRVNRALLTEFGYRQEEVKGQNVSVLMPEEIAVKHDRYLKRYLETGVATVIGSTLRMQARRKLGTTFPVELRVGVSRDVKGQPVFFAFLRNISRELLLERQLKINDALMNMIPTPLIAIDGTGIVTMFSTAAERTWGYRADQVLGRNVSMLMPEHIGRNHSFFLERYQKTKVKTMIDKVTVQEACDGMGRIFPVEISLREIRAARRGGANWFFACCRDMTDDGETRQVRQWNAQVMELLPSPLLQVNPKGFVLSMNAAAEAEFGYSRDEVVGRDVGVLLPSGLHALPSDGTETREQKDKWSVLLSGTRRSEARRKNGTMFPVEIKAAEVTIEGSAEKSVFIGYVRNIAEELSWRRASDLSSLFFELSPNPLIAINDSGIVIMFSRAACESFHYSCSADVVGKNVSILVPEDLAPSHDGYLKAYKKTGRRNVIGTERKVLARRSDGVLFSCSMTVHEVKMDNSEGSVFLGSILDQSVEMSVQYISSISNAIISLSEDAVFLVDKEGIIQRMSPVTSTIFGYGSDDSLIGQNVLILIGDSKSNNNNSSTRGDKLSFYDQFVKTRRQYLLSRKRVVDATRRDGSIFRVELSLREIDKGDSKLYVGHLRDLAPADDLQDRRRLNVAITDSSPVPIIIINPLGVVRVFTPASEEFFRYSAAEVVGRNVKMLMSSEDASRHDEYLARYQQTEVKNILDKTVNQLAKLKNGELVPIGLRVKELPSRHWSDKGDFIAYVIDRRRDFLVARSEKLSEVLVEVVPFPVLLVTEVGQIRECSHHVLEHFGYTVDQLRGQSLSLLMPLSSLTPESWGPNNEIVAGVRGSNERTGATSTTARFSPGAPSGRGGTAGARSAASAAEGRTERRGAQEAADHWDDGAASQGSFTRRVQVLQRDGSLREMVLHASPLHRPSNDVNTFHQRFLIFMPIKKLPEVTHMRQFFHSLAEFSSVAMVESNAFNDISLFNRAASHTFGWRPEEIIGVNCGVLMNVELARIHDVQMERYRNTRTPRVVGRRRPIPAMRKDGTVIGLDLSLQELGDDFIAYLGSVDQRKLDTANAALIDSISEKLPEAVIVVSLEDNIIAFSRAASALLGYTQAEVQSAQLFLLDGIVVPHDRLTQSGAASSVAYETQYMDNGLYRPTIGVRSESEARAEGASVKLASIEAKESTRRAACYKKDGSVMDVELTVKEAREASGERVFVVFIRDCSLDNESAMQTELGEALIETSPQAIISTDTKGTILRFNAMAEQLFQFKRAQVIGRNVKFLMPDKYAMHHDGYIQQYLLTGVKRVVDRVRTVTAERKNGDVFTAELGLREVMNQAGAPCMFVGYIREVTGQ